MESFGWPNQRESKEAGCTCEWWGRGAIITFDSECPVLDRHRGVPDELTQAATPTRIDVALADKVIRGLGLSTSP